MRTLLAVLSLLVAGLGAPTSVRTQEPVVEVYQSPT